MALFLGATPSLFAQSKITDFTTNLVGKGLRIEIAGTDLNKRPKELRAMRNTIYIVEFNAHLAPGLKPMKRTLNSESASTVQFGWYSARPPKVRVSIHLSDAAIVPVLKQTANGWVISVNTPQNAGSDNELVNAINKQKGTRIGEDATPMLTGGGTDAPDFQSLVLRDEDMSTNTVAVLPGQLPRPVSNQTQPKVDTKPKPKKDDGFTPVVPKGFEKQVKGSKVERTMVSLDFVATDVNLVLKSLAAQTGANIVTAPNMNGRVTVSITNTPVEEALDYVTHPAGLRWEKVRGTTYVVAPKEKIREIVSDLSRRDQMVSTTRIVPIFSGDILQIKETVSRAFLPTSSDGTFEMILSSEIKTEKKEESSKSDGGGESKGGEDGKSVDPGAGGGGGGSESSSKAEKSQVSTAPLDNLYVVLIGNAEIVERVEGYIEQLDRKICDSYGVEYPTTGALTTDTYVIKSRTLKAKDMIENIVVQGMGQSFPKVAMHSSPPKGERQAVIIVGRANEVSRAKSLLAEFDGAGDNIAVYDVLYSDPRTLRDQLIGFIPGLQVNFAPASAANPRLYAGTLQSLGTSDAIKGTTSSTNAGSDVAAKNNQASSSGLAQNYSDLELTAQPMKLVLNGTPDQIARAMAYLDRLDVEPRQVAVDLRVVELSKDDSTKLGIDWSLLTNGVLRNISISQNGGNSAAGNYNVNGQTGTFSALMDELEARGRVLSRPNLMAVDGRETETFIGERIPYVKSIQATSNGITVLTETVDIGIGLSTIARIGGDGKITLDLRPTVRSLKSFIPVAGGGSLPNTIDRILQSTVIMNSGETIALGGLITEADTRSFGGIPILKDLPIIGRLFSRETRTKTRTEIVFFITVREIDSTTRSRAAAPRDAEKNNGKIDEYNNEVNKKKKGS